MKRQQPGSREMGREAFIKRVWEWKAESGGAIIGQLKRLGASCDWSRERFTMDEGLSRAVAKVFVELYRSGLIYKDKRLVNWDPKLKTAISDLEVQQVETKGSLWYIKYPILDETNRFITVATTRPETMFGDMAVAIHPGDERYTGLIGKEVLLPLADRRIAIIADEYSDPEKGTGAVKITPAHDFNDFEVWRRYVSRISDDDRRRFEEVNNGREVDNLINILTPDGRLKSSSKDDYEAIQRAAWPMPDHIENRRRKAGDSLADALSAGFADFNLIPEEYRGLDRFAARKRVVERLETVGLIEKIESTTHAVPHGDRSGEVIEPYLTDQWYVDAKTLAHPAIEAVRERRTTLVPTQWEATFFNWMENIQPWCISRQIWWGHQIPAWYGPDGKVFAAASEAEAVSEAISFYESKGSHYETDFMPFDGVGYANRLRSGKSHLHRDEDVLDTWFSSALWPFSTLGWPDETPDLKRFYPTSVLVTGFDIIFFWVARMMMMGLHFMKEVPFPTVYIHALVRDATGAKMSKSKGNVIDPLQLIDEYGADALRFTLAAMAAPGRDIKLSSERVAGYRNFATKLWNAARFAELNECVAVADFDPSSVKGLVNRWIVSQLGDALGRVEIALADYRFNDAANVVYQFVWNLYCDWYLELAKPIFVGLDEKPKSETRATVAYVRDEIIKILHPFMPFITEELWQVAETNRREPMLALAAWPGEQPNFPEAHEELGWLIELVSTVRSVRTEMNVPPSSLVQIEFINPSDATRKRAQVWDGTFNRLARISGSIFTDKVRPGSVQMVVGGEIVALQLQGVIDLAAEGARLAKEMAKADADIARVDAKLGNPNFVARAPEDVVEEEKEKREEAQARKAKIAEALERLKGAA
jgi:valyl-tRNA synthetase